MESQSSTLKRKSDYISDMYFIIVDFVQLLFPIPGNVRWKTIPLIKSLNIVKALGL